MQLLYLLEKIRIPGLNELMLLITQLGDETAFLIIALVVFWCVDKRRGYYVMAVGFVGTITNQFLKLLCRIPRPWVLDEQFTILEAAREGASGYSFPSGHTQSAVGTFGCLAATTQRKWLRWSYIALAALVGFSRMYVGVHTPYDVLVGAASAIALVFLLKPLIYGSGDRGMKLLLGGMLLVSVAYLLFVELWPFPADVDAHNLQSGTENAYTLLGCVIGVVTVYFADQKWLHFQVKAVWWAQILKVLCGLILVLAVKSGLKAPLNALFAGHHAARAVRYFLVVLTAGIVWPMTFSWFSRLGTGKRAEGGAQV